MSFYKSDKFLGIVYVTISAILFSSKGVIIKSAYAEGIDSITFLMFRYLFSFPFYVGMLIIYSKSGQYNPTKKEFLLITFLSLIGYYLSSLLDFYGLEYVSAGLERLILFIYPTITTLIGVLFFKKKVNKWVYISLIMTYIGIFGVVVYDISTQGSEIWKGVIMILACAIMFAIYLVFSDDLVHKFGTIRYTSMVMIISSLGVFVQFCIQREVFSLLNFSPKIYVLGIVLAIFGTVLPSYLMTDGIKKIGASSTSITATLGPVWTIVLANLVLGEPIYLAQIIGISLVVGGVFLASKK